MCQALGDFRREFTGFAQSFEPGLLAPGDLEVALAHLGALEKTAAALASMVAAEMAKVGKPGQSHKQAARRLARASGTSLKEAERAIGAAEAIRSEPEVEAAARSGGLSRQQAAIVAEGAAANPGAAPGLLEVAASASLSELAGAAARAKAAASGPEERREEIRRSRSLRSYTGPDGVWHLHAQGLPEDGARVMAALQPGAERAFAAARKEGRREAPEAYAFDALVALATSGGGGAAPNEVVFRVDLAAFFRGYPAGDEVMEVAGFGPTSAKAVADVLEHGAPFLKAVMTKGKDVVGVAHLGRRPNAHQRTALDWVFPTCAAEGCGVRTSFCETDHREPWARTHFTLLDLLDRLCRAHHAMKTNEGWALVEGKGKRPFVPPSDPRHPRFAKKAGGGAGTGPPAGEGPSGAGEGPPGAGEAPGPGPGGGP
ncbi:MAG: hypothetical protein M0005_06995 [Actinomycetota bacterium]|jgi:hypothetical protein|nr:hypothetical protein [Actinomycetota bacterium]